MIINPNETSGIFSLGEIQKALKLFTSSRKKQTLTVVHPSAIAQHMSLKPQEAKKLLQRMSKEGYVNKYDGGYIIKEPGIRLAHASIDYVPRAQAQRALDTFLDRVNTINTKKVPCIFHIPIVVVFGSFAEGKDQVGDIDISFSSPFRKDLKDRIQISEEIYKMESAEEELGLSIPTLPPLEYAQSWLQGYLKQELISLLYLDEFCSILKSDNKTVYKILVGDRSTLIQQYYEILFCRYNNGLFHGMPQRILEKHILPNAIKYLKAFQRRSISKKIVNKHFDFIFKKPERSIMDSNPGLTKILEKKLMDDMPKDHLR